jgi:hypothetical protein
MREPCCMCGEESDDWAVEAGIIYPSYSICRKCKLILGQAIEDRWEATIIKRCLGCESCLTPCGREEGHES